MRKITLLCKIHSCFDWSWLLLWCLQWVVVLFALCTVVCWASSQRKTYCGTSHSWRMRILTLYCLIRSRGWLLYIYLLSPFIHFCQLCACMISTGTCQAADWWVLYIIECWVVQHGCVWLEIVAVMFVLLHESYSHTLWHNVVLLSMVTVAGSQLSAPDWTLSIVVLQ